MLITALHPSERSVISMTPALAGTLAGLMRVVSGPDHRVAGAPLAIRKPTLGLRVGTARGLGHATGFDRSGVAFYRAVFRVPTRNRSEKGQRAVLFHGGRRSSRSEERPKGAVNTASEKVVWQSQSACIGWFPGGHAHSFLNRLPAHCGFTGRAGRAGYSNCRGLVPSALHGAIVGRWRRS